MKPTTLFSCALVLLLATHVTIATYASIEPEVYAELQNDPEGSAYILVVLQSSTGPEASLSEVRAAVAAEQDEVLGAFDPGEFTIAYRYQTVAALTGYVDAAGLQKLAANSNVVSVGLNASGSATLDTSVPLINADDVHAMGLTGKGITVAVLDTGIDTTHADLSDCPPTISRRWGESPGASRRPFSTLSPRPSSRRSSAGTVGPTLISSVSSCAVH